MFGATLKGKVSIGQELELFEKLDINGSFK